MRKCPTCSVALETTRYEGFNVWHCRSCGGHLLPNRTLESIKKTSQHSTEQLEVEAEPANAPEETDTKEINCPRCHLKMRKQVHDLQFMELVTDECDSCNVIWLDDGELAMLQLAHEQSSEFINAQELKDRMAELEASPERKARFEKTLAKLPKEKSLFSQVIGGIFGDMLTARTRYHHRI